MAIVRSSGALKTYSDPRVVGDAPVRGSGLDQMTPQTYAAIYRTQPQVRTVVDFLARNIAQLGLHAFRRIDDLDRERLANHELIQWVEHPTPATCRYRLFETLILDLGIYFNAYWLKLRTDDAIGLLRLSPETITPRGWLLPSAFVWTLPDGRTVDVAPKDIVHFNGYDPSDQLMGLSPIETLRQILAEDCASTTYRRAFWTNSARLEGVIQRPREAPKWTAEQKQAFREQWQARFAGSSNAGQTAVLEDGMTFTPTSYSARDSEFTTARKLTREEVAAAYHVPQPMVGILDHATFSNIKEQHKQLYQDCLGPWLEWVQEELERQLLVECDDQQGVYLEFNIQDKLKGSFEEQASALYTLVGRPIMTANEGRARLNLSRVMDDPSADELALPLNTQTGASAPDPSTEPGTALAAAALTSTATAPVIQRAWMRQRTRLDKLPADERAVAFDVARWDRELAEALEPLYRAIGCSESDALKRAATLAATVNADTLQLLVKREDAFSPAREAALYV